MVAARGGRAMSRECRVEIHSDGNDKVQVIVKGENLPQAGQKYTRTLPQFDAVQIDAFRRGDVQALEAEQLSENVSDWLFGVDMRPVVKTWLSQNAAERVRFIFSVDDELQYRFGDVPLELLRTEPASGHLVIHAGVE